MPISKQFLTPIQYPKRMNEKLKQSKVVSLKNEVHNQAKYTKHFNNSSSYSSISGSKLSLNNESPKLIKNFKSKNSLMLPPTVVRHSPKQIHFDARKLIASKTFTQSSNNYVHKNCIKRKVKRTANNSLVIDIGKFSEYSPSGELPNSSSIICSNITSTPVKNALKSMDETYNMMHTYAPMEDSVSIYSTVKRNEANGIMGKTLINNDETDQIQLVEMLIKFRQAARSKMAVEVLSEYVFKQRKSKVFSQDFTKITNELLIQLIEFSDLASIEQLINVAINANLNLGSVTYKKMIDAVHNEDNKSTASNFLNLATTQGLLSRDHASILTEKWVKESICRAGSQQHHKSKLSNSCQQFYDPSSPSISRSRNNSGNKLIKMCEEKHLINVNDSSSQFQQAIINGDWKKAGQTFHSLICCLGAKIHSENLLISIVFSLINGECYDPCNFFSFDRNARFQNETNYQHVISKEEITKTLFLSLSDIAMTLIYVSVPGYAYHVISYLIRNSLVNYKSNNLVESKANKNIPNLISNFIKFLKVSQQNSDFILAKELLYDFFSSPIIQKKYMNYANDVIEVVCDIVTHATDMSHYEEALHLLQLIPHKQSESEKIGWMIGDILLNLMLNESCKTERVSKIMCIKQCADMLLAQKSTSPIRIALSSGGKINEYKSTLFSHLEFKGLYRAPRIEMRPHLILLPHTMSLTEMTLSIYRHLTNFVKFLMNINESVNLKIPLRIVLLKECHHFDPLDPKIFPEERYFKGEERLVETVQKLLEPPLRIIKRETVESYKETMYIIDMKTVRLWFLMNTNYKDTEKNKAVGLLDKPSKHQKAEALHSFANNCSTVVNSLTSSLQNQPPNPFCIEKVLHDIIE